MEKVYGYPYREKALELIKIVKSRPLLEASAAIEAALGDEYRNGVAGGAGMSREMLDASGM